MRRPCPLAVLSSLVLCTSLVRADEAPEPEPKQKSYTTLQKAGHWGSEALVPFMLAGGVGVAASGEHEGHRLTRSAEAMLATGGLTEALKKLTHERRPNGADNESFPSGHASLSFATATLIDAYQPHYKGLAYGAATWISISRVIVRAHYAHDVIAGAALGHFVTREFTNKYRDNGEADRTTLPAAAPGQFMLPPALNQDTKWKFRVGAGQISFGRSW